MMFPQMAEEEVRGSSSIDSHDSGKKMCMLGDGIDDNHDGIVLHGFW